MKGTVSMHATGNILTSNNLPLTNQNTKLYTVRRFSKEFLKLLSNTQTSSKLNWFISKPKRFIFWKSIQHVRCIAANLAHLQW